MQPERPRVAPRTCRAVALTAAALLASVAVPGAAAAQGPGRPAPATSGIIAVLIAQHHAAAPAPGFTPPIGTEHGSVRPGG